MYNSDSYRRTDTTLLRAIGIMLIVNSHLDRIYPIPFIATGGAIGNSLFFVLSAYGLYLSYQIKPKPFFPWYKRRVLRLYPSIWCSLLLLGIPYEFYFKTYFVDEFAKITLKGVGIFAINFIYPLELWFIPALLAFYFIGYFVIRSYSKSFKTVFVLTAILYFYVYLFKTDLSVWAVEIQKIRYIFYLSIFLFGILLGRYDAKIKYSGIADYFLLLLLVFILYGHKLAMHFGYMMKIQGIEQLVIFPMIFYFIKINKNYKMHEQLRKIPLLAKFIDILGRNTLEIFIVHQYFVSTAYYLRIHFPISLIYVIAGTLLISVLINYVATIIRNNLNAMNRSLAKVI